MTSDGDIAAEGPLARIEDIAETTGASLERLDARHVALTRMESATLLVGFERAEALAGRRERMPLTARIAEESGFSHITLLAEGETWFRAPPVHAFFDRLVDEGTLDGFDRVVFYGARMCGYAAAAYSVAAPGALVLALAPQATLDPRIAEWDRRYLVHRRLDFTTRYGYAPDMLDAAARAHVLYDPEQRLDAMHTALFTRANVTKIRCRHFGGELEDELLSLGILDDILDAACEGKLSASVLHRLLRARRDHPPYLRRLLAHLDARNQDLRAAILCRSVVSRRGGPRFRKRLRELSEEFDAAGRALPASRERHGRAAGAPQR